MLKRLTSLERLVEWHDVYCGYSYMRKGLLKINNNTSNNRELFSSTRTKVRVDDVIEVGRVDSL